MVKEGILFCLFHTIWVYTNNCLKASIKPRLIICFLLSWKSSSCSHYLGDLRENTSGPLQLSHFLAAKAHLLPLLSPRLSVIHAHTSEREDEFARDLAFANDFFRWLISERDCLMVLLTIHSFRWVDRNGHRGRILKHDRFWNWFWF